MTIEPGGDPTKRWGMVIDVQKCVGCNSCTVACKHSNVTPPGVQWRSVRDFEIGEYPNVERIFMPVGCMHCSEPPCMEVCPTTATRQREDGLVIQRYDLCIGCGYCHVACPYQARFLVKDAIGSFEGRASRVEQVHYQRERLGVSTKCTFCVEKVDEAKGTGLTPGIDGEVTPACALSCIAQAIHFGDLNDPDSNVSVMVREKATTLMHEELGTKPNLVYAWHQLRDADGNPIPEPSGRPAMKPIPANRQDNWDLRAVGNFALGGTGSGFLALLSLVSLTPGGVELPTLRITVADFALAFDLFHLGAAMIALGLFSVFLEISRRARFLNVFLGARTSWMSREAIVAVMLMAVAAINLFVVATTLSMLVSLLAVLFLYFQARILQTAKGIPAWRQPVMTWMLVFSGLLEGLGLLAIVAWVAGLRLSGYAFLLPAAGLGLAAANLFLWNRYLKICSDGVPPESYDALKSHSLFIQIGCRIIPAALFAISMLVPVDLAAALQAVGGLISIAGGWYWKMIVICRASHFQNFHLKSFPIRGSGIMAAPNHLTH